MANNNSNLQVILNGNSVALVESIEQANRVLQSFAEQGTVASREVMEALNASSFEEVGALQRLANESKITAENFQASGVKIQEAMQGVSAKAETAANQTVGAADRESQAIQNTRRATQELNNTPVEPKASNFFADTAKFAAGIGLFTLANDAVKKLSDTVKGGAEVYIEYQKQIVAVTEGLKSSHDAHKTTTADIEQFATAQEKATGITKNQNLAVAATLLNFKEINADQLPKYIKLVDDAAATMDHGVPSASRLASVAGIIGKALERPNNVAQALGRSLGDLSQEQIKAIHDHYNLAAAADKTGTSLSRENTIARHGAEQTARDQETIVKKTKAVQDAQANLAKAQSEQYVDESFRQAAIAKAHDKVTAATQALNDAQTRLGSHQQDLGDKMTAAQARAAKGTGDHNDLVGAQALLYEDLVGIVGGRAASATETLAGKEARLKTVFQDIAITIGQKLQDAFNNIYPHLVDFGIAALQVADDFNRSLQPAIAFLSPIIGDLVRTITETFIPALGQLWQDTILPLIQAIGPVVGAGLVGALGLLINIVNGALTAVSWLARNFDNFLPIVATLGAAFVLLRAKMAIEDAIGAIKVGFTTLQLITIPSLLTSLEAVAAFFTTPWGIAITVAAVAVGAITTMLQQHKEKTDSAKESMRQLADQYNQAADALQKNRDKLSGAMFDHEGATLAVERAQLNYNNAVKTYGKNSLEAREALHGLQGAQNDQKSSVQAVADAQQAVNDKQKWFRENYPPMILKLRENEHFIRDSAGAWKAVADSLDTTAQNGNKVNDMVKGLKMPAPNVPAAGSKAFSTPFHFASGVENFAGGLAIVGEEGPELVHLPAGSSVTPADKTANMMNGGIAGAASVTLNVHVGNYMGSTADRQKLATQLWQELQRIERQHGKGGSLPNIGVLPV